MAKDFEKIINQFSKADNLIKRIEILNDDKDVIAYLKKHPDFIHKIKDSIEEEYTFKILMCINQAENILYDFEKINTQQKLLKELSKKLFEIDNFYSEIGGIIGYHRSFLNLLNKETKVENINFLETHPFDLREKENTQEYIDIGLKNLKEFAFIFPMGGSGDRLKLINKMTNEPLPVAMLEFQGYTLLEHLIRDVFALEYLYFKTFKEEISLPIVIMTSDDKDNHNHIISILEEKNYFNRDKKKFFFIKQISSPVISENGNWTLQSPLKLALKPSGHGVIWHLMAKKKIFDSLKSLNIKKAIVRQINNPLASLDYLLLAFMGVGIKLNKSFGFVTIPKMEGFKEGLVVLKEKIINDGFLYNYSNIEYTEFEKKSIKSFENYFANTNILFVDLSDVQKASFINPFPGLMINLKSKVYSKNKKGEIEDIKAGRLESMMQNISDSITDFKKEKINLDTEKNLKTFIALNTRNKTISTTKNAYDGKDYFETPIKSFFDVLNNYLDLLKNYSRIDMPQMPDIKEFILKGPPFIAYLNPMIGPLYSEISKKIKGGKIIYGSEIRLDIAEILIENIYLDGSIIIETNLIKNSNKNIYNESSCVLKNVTIKNLGIDKSANNIYFENKIKRKESFKIILGENSHFYANNIEFFNSHEIIVPSFHKMFILKTNEKVIYKVEKI